MTQIAGLCAALGLGMVGTARLVAVNRQLHAARRELARLAVTDERLRIARDLHDLLGHSLTLIAIKSQLAGRLTTAAPKRAQVENEQIEAVARAALDEVRQVVSGYRQPTLAEELEQARGMLVAAGISCELHDDWPTLAAATESALSWALREAVTNVIRHSGAHHCVIVVSETVDAVQLEVVDDGHAVTDKESDRGNGLAGIAERITQVGGSWSASPEPRGGFRLSVRVPSLAA